MTECSQKSREKFLKKVFKLRNKETWTEIEPWVIANQPSNNQTQRILTVVLALYLMFWSQQKFCRFNDLIC